MNKFVKSLLVAGSVAALAACSSSNNDAAGNGANNNGQTFGGYSVEDLQQRYNTVYFGFDKFNIEGEYVQILDAHAAYLNATPASKVVVEGNTDERGTREYNMALGERRAKAVQRYLVLQGVSPAQLELVSYGKERPIATGNDEQSWAQNRRVELRK